MNETYGADESGEFYEMLAGELFHEAAHFEEEEGRGDAARGELGFGDDGVDGSFVFADGVIDQALVGLEGSGAGIRGGLLGGGAREEDAEIVEDIGGGGDEFRPLLDEAIRAAGNDQPVSEIAIGPEGGWAPNEEALFDANGWKAVSLGPRILRAETAAIAALAVLASSLE